MEKDGVVLLRKGWKRAVGNGYGTDCCCLGGSGEDGGE